MELRSRSWKIGVEYPGPQPFTLKGTQRPGRKAESLVHPVTPPTKPSLHSEGDKDAERKATMLLRRARGCESQSGQGDDQNGDTAPLKTFPDPRGGHAAAGTERIFRCEIRMRNKEEF